MGSTKGGTRADTRILMGRSLGSPWPLPWPRCPHSPGSSSGAPFNPPQLGRRHPGNRMGIQVAGGRGGECIAGSAKKALKAVGWWAGGLSLAERGWSLEQACYQHGHIVQKGQGPCHGPTIRGSSQSWGQEGSLEAPRRKADLGWEVGDCLDLARG